MTKVDSGRVALSAEVKVRASEALVTQAADRTIAGIARHTNMELSLIVAVWLMLAWRLWLGTLLLWSGTTCKTDVEA